MKRVFEFKSLLKESTIIHNVSKKSIDEKLLFSLALHTGEDSSMILSNREKIAQSIGSQYHFIVANQTHSDNIKIIDIKESRGWSSIESAIRDCDALITDQKGVILTILTADCVPILLYDRVKEVVAIAHAGWRGTKMGIAMKSVTKMREEFGSSPSDIVVGIAPSIGRCCYEVDRDVASHFFEYPNALTQNGDKYHLDLPLINQEQLISIGIAKESIEMSGICTACSVDEYFSYRKEGGCSGRFMSMIGLKH
jgi:YfiH family protein